MDFELWHKIKLLFIFNIFTYVFDLRHIIKISMLDFLLLQMIIMHNMFDKVIIFFLKQFSFFN